MVPNVTDYRVAAQFGVLITSIEEGGAEAGMPAAEAGGALGVVGEEEIVDGVRDAGATSFEVRLDPRIDTRLVRGLARPPGLVAQDGGHGDEGTSPPGR
jgi:hypothetical protein